MFDGGGGGSKTVFVGMDQKLFLWGGLITFPCAGVDICFHIIILR